MPIVYEKPYEVVLVPVSSLRPHEFYIEDRVRRLMREILRDGSIRRPVIVDAKTMTILDGHHRVEVARRLGLARVPAILVDYDSDCVTVDSWKKNIAVTKDTVRRAASSGRLLPPRTSRHRLCFEIPEARTPLSALAAAETRHLNPPG